MEMLEDFKRETEEIFEDMEDVRMDRKEQKYLQRKAVDREKELKQYISETELRQHQIDQELDAIEEEGSDSAEGAMNMVAGWADALVQEAATLTFKQNLAREEIRLQRILHKRAEEYEQRLSLEIEELELDLDTVSVQTSEEYELLRRTQVCS